VLLLETTLMLATATTKPAYVLLNAVQPGSSIGREFSYSLQELCTKAGVALRSD
jgi:hypothetical protein